MARRLSIALATVVTALVALTALRAFAGGRVDDARTPVRDASAFLCTVVYTEADCVKCHGVNPHRPEAAVPVALPPEPSNCARCHEQVDGVAYDQSLLGG